MFKRWSGRRRAAILLSAAMLFGSLAAGAAPDFPEPDLRRCLRLVTSLMPACVPSVPTTPVGTAGIRN